MPPAIPRALAALLTLSSIGVAAALQQPARLAARPRRFESAPRPVSREAFEGSPSTPGWASGRLDALTDWATSYETNRPVICEYQADPFWLWTKWRGTVLQQNVIAVLATMALGIGIDVAIHALFSGASWPLGAAPPDNEVLFRQIKGLNTLWSYHLTLCTFILTFFTQQAYAYWRAVYFTTRAIQGRINDICLLLAVGAERDPIEDDDDDDDAIEGATRYSDDAAALLRRCTRLLRLSHTFFWAATPTCSNGVGDGGFEDGDEQVRKKDRGPGRRRARSVSSKRQGGVGAVCGRNGSTLKSLGSASTTRARALSTRSCFAALLLCLAGCSSRGAPHLGSWFAPQAPALPRNQWCHSARTRPSGTARGGAAGGSGGGGGGVARSLARSERPAARLPERARRDRAAAAERGGARRAARRGRAHRA